MCQRSFTRQIPSVCVRKRSKQPVWKAGLRGPGVIWLCTCPGAVAGAAQTMTSAGARTHDAATTTEAGRQRTRERSGEQMPCRQRGLAPPASPVRYVHKGARGREGGVDPWTSPMLDAGVDLRDVQVAARHADPRTMMRYDRARRTSTATPTTSSLPTLPPAHSPRSQPELPMSGRGAMLCPWVDSRVGKNLEPSTDFGPCRRWPLGELSSSPCLGWSSAT
jgi:hypothetical protein